MCLLQGLIDHVVAIIGYDAEEGEDYWEVKNSWGTDWGENGYIKFHRETGLGIGICGINLLALYPHYDI